ncbi:MAG: c-type cytochrome [Luteimonas sp.]
MRKSRAYAIAAIAPAVAGMFAVAAAAYAQQTTPQQPAASEGEAPAASTTTAALPDNAPVQATALDAVAELAKAHWGDAKAGATKAGACAACHGLDGNPSDPQYPRLAGMPERYVATQLALFKSGERSTGMAAVMMPMAAPLSAQDMRDLGAFFAQQKAGAGIADDTVIADGAHKGMKFYEVGQQLFHGGDPARGIPACMACHGPTGAGNPGPAYPHIGGQQAAYVQRRLEEYRAGTTNERDHHNFDVMATVAHQLTDEEIGSLSSYVQGLHARSDEAPASTK